MIGYSVRSFKSEELSEYGATVENINDGAYKYRVTAHVHDFSEGDCPCGEKAPTASILSDGSFWIILAVVVVALAAVIVLVVMKKKSEGK